VQVSTRPQGFDELGPQDHGANGGDAARHPQQETKWDALRRWSKAVLTKDRVGHTRQKLSEQNDKSSYLIQRKRGMCSANKVAPTPPGELPTSHYMPSRRRSAWCSNKVAPVLLDARAQRAVTSSHPQTPAAAPKAWAESGKFRISSRPASTPVSATRDPTSSAQNQHLTPFSLRSWFPRVSSFGEKDIPRNGDRDLLIPACAGENAFRGPRANGRSQDFWTRTHQQ